MSIRDDIFKKTALEYKVIDIPEWGGNFQVKKLSVSASMRIMAAKNAGIGMTLLIINCLLDMEGKPVFGKSDENALLQMDIDLISDVATKMNEANGIKPPVEVVGESGKN